MVLAATAYPRRCWRVRRTAGRLLAEARSRSADIVVGVQVLSDFYVFDKENSGCCLGLLNASM